MINFIKIVDAVRRASDDETSRAQVNKITIMSDGHYRADGCLVRRNTMFIRAWNINRETFAVLEL
jgi:hypothetical protein